MAVETTQVLTEVATVREPFLTELAEVRSVVDVDSHVTAQLRAVWECLAAV